MAEHFVPPTIQKKKNSRNEILAYLYASNKPMYEVAKKFDGKQWGDFFRKMRLEQRRLDQLSKEQNTSSQDSTSTTSSTNLPEPSLPNEISNIMPNLQRNVILKPEFTINTDSHNPNNLAIKIHPHLNNKSSMINFGRAMKIGSFFNNCGLITVDKKGNIINTGSSSVIQNTDISGNIELKVVGPISPPRAYNDHWSLDDDFSEPIKVSEISCDGHVLRTHVTLRTQSNNFTTGPDCLRFNISGNLTDTTILIKASSLGDTVFIKYDPPNKETKIETENRLKAQEDMNGLLDISKKRKMKFEEPEIDGKKKNKANKNKKTQKINNEELKPISEHITDLDKEVSQFEEAISHDEETNDRDSDDVLSDPGIDAFYSRHYDSE